MVAVAAYNCQFLVTSLPSVAFVDETTNTTDLTTFTISNALHRYYDLSVPTVIQVAHDEIQSVAITGTPTGGTFTLSFGGNTTTALAYNAAASVIQAALQLLASIGSGNALVTGVFPNWTVQFTGLRGMINQINLTATSSLTGGSSPAITITETQAGAPFTTTTSGFSFYGANAHVVFPVVQATNTQVRFHSGNYLPYANFGDAHTADFSAKMDLVDTTKFNTDGTHDFTPTLISGILKCSTWWSNQTILKHLVATDILIVSFVTPTGNRYEGYCYVGDTNLKADIKSAIGEELTFHLTNQFFSV